MTSLRATIVATLNGDATLLTSLPGGVFDSGQLPRDGLTVDNAPYDSNGILKGCAVVRLRAGNPIGYGPHNAERRFAEVYVYHPYDYTVIDAAIRRIKALLQRVNFGITDNEGLAHLTWAGDLGENYDEGLASKMDRVRWEINLTRKDG